MSWACPRCDRTFRQVNQRHACGVGSAATLLKSRPPALTDLYRKLESTVRGFGEVEVVTIGGLVLVLPVECGMRFAWWFTSVAR